MGVGAGKEGGRGETHTSEYPSSAVALSLTHSQVCVCVREIMYILMALQGHNRGCICSRSLLQLDTCGWKAFQIYVPPIYACSLNSSKKAFGCGIDLRRSIFFSVPMMQINV